MLLINALRAGTAPPLFKSKNHLADFIKDDPKRRCFPLAAAKVDGFVKIFLLDVFHHA